MDLTLIQWHQEQKKEQEQIWLNFLFKYIKKNSLTFFDSRNDGKAYK
jgi:hypothetical protein